MKTVVKRNGNEVSFDKQKIIDAILNSYTEVYKVVDTRGYMIANEIAESISRLPIGKLEVEEIQNYVEFHLMKEDVVLAKAYIIYRYNHEIIRKSNTTDKSILELLNGTNEYWNTENSNKDTKDITVQRDYLAGITSTDITMRLLLPKDVVEAHNKGILHFHDADYFAQKALFNCCLINLEDMLQNGTVISGKMIEKPHSFQTACTIATQIIAKVASSQYGGQTISLAHLAPFVDISRQKYIKEVKAEIKPFKDRFTKEEYESYIDNTVKRRLAREICAGIQTIQYQVITLMTTNGQAPFLSVFMYLNEVEEGQLRDDLAMIIEEVLRQRIKGVKNEKGAWVSPAFPKLLYVLQEDNVRKDNKYYYLTKLSAYCTAKRLVPDYISEKVMFELKEGNCFACMGCRSFLAPYKDENGNYKFYGRLTA